MGIGISVETDAVRLAESRGGKVIRCAEYPYPSGVTPQGEAFPTFLRRCLSGFSSSWQRASIWATGSLPSLQIRYLALPPQPRGGSVTDLVYWTFRKDVPFDTAGTVFDYGIEDSGGPDGMRVSAYTVDRAEFERFTAPFTQAGIRLAGVVIPSFAMRALLRVQDGAESGARLGLFTGEDASTVIMVKDNRVRLSRVFKTGMHAILADIREREPGLTPAEAYRRACELPADEEAARPVGEVIDRLVQQIERTIAAYLNEHPGETVSGLHVMGPVAGFDLLKAALHERLGIEVLPLSLPGDAGGLAALAGGASLSRPDSTPNVQAPCSRREKEARGSWWSLLIALLLGLVLALLHLTRGVLHHANDQLERRLAGETAKLAAYSVRLDAPMLQALAARTTAESVVLRQMTRRWLPLAALGELGRLTPEPIRITGIDATFATGTEAPVATRGRVRRTSQGAVLKLQGLVRGPQDTQRSLLAAYALKLEKTPLFARADVAHVSAGMEGAEPVLLFGMELTTEALSRPAVAAPAVKEAQP